MCGVANLDLHYLTMPADALAALETWISQQPGYSASLASLSEFYALHPLFKTELKGRLCQVIDASPTTILAVDNSRIFQRVFGTYSSSLPEFSESSISGVIATMEDQGIPCGKSFAVKSVLQYVLELRPTS